MKKEKLIILSLIFIWGCSKTKKNVVSERPHFEIIDMTVPEDASLKASVEFKIVGGAAPYTMFKKEFDKIDTIDAATFHYKISGLRATLTPRKIRVMDSEFGGDVMEIDFPLPEPKAIGKIKNADGSITDIEYKFENFGTEKFPFYMMNEDVRSNVYSDGNDTPVPWTLTTMGDLMNDDGFRAKEYTLYSFDQAFHVNGGTFDFSDPNLYDWRIQGICPKYWHIATNADWIRLHEVLGIDMEKPLPTPTLTGTGHINVANALDQSPFNVGYSPSNFPASRGGSGVGWWSASVAKDQSQFIYVIRYENTRSTFNAWGNGGLHGSRAWLPLAVRCVFDFN